MRACFNKKGLCLFYDSAIRADQLLPQLLMELFDTLYTLCIHNVDTLNMTMKDFGSQKLIIDKNLDNFSALC